MNLKPTLLKLTIGILGVFLLLTGVEYGYSIFDILDDNRSETLQTGVWNAGTPITTAQEFYDFATSSTSLSTDHYYLANDIDFSGFVWTYTSAYNNNEFHGTLSGNNYTLSNITITSTDTNSIMVSIFSRMNGATIRDLKIENYKMGFSSTFFNSLALQSGVLASEVSGTNNLIENITLSNVDVIANSLNGAGGLIGQVQGNTDLTISNIKATDLTVLNTSKRAGGLISRVLRGAGTLIIEDIDLQGNIAGDNRTSNTGGLIGTLQDTSTSIDRVIVEYTAEGTIALSDTSITMKAERYVGGFIGNQKSSGTITNAFYTGTLYETINYLGSAIGREQGSISLIDVYYSNVLFNATNTAPTNTTGLNGTLVLESAMPSISWWNGFAVDFYVANSLWQQDATGRLELIR
jgi:hypothetical protein